MEEAWPTCDYCGMPGICFGADLANPMHRCPIHCREHRQFGGVHGRDAYESHLLFEGIEQNS